MPKGGFRMGLSVPKSTVVFNISRISPQSTRRGQTFRRGLISALVFVFFFAASVGSAVQTDAAEPRVQVQEEILNKEERLNRLKLKEAELNLQQAEAALESYREEYESIKELFDQEVVTLKEVNEAHRNYEEAMLIYEEAEIELERAKLNFLEFATHISIVEAKTYNTREGERMAEMTLGNTSRVSQAITSAELISGGEVLSREKIAGWLEVQNIIISLEESGTIVAEPYEVIIPSLKLGEQKTLTFRLLRDSPRVGVRMRFLDTERVMSIVLKKEALQDVPTINSAQFSQEGALGTKVRFDILLERLSEEEKTFRLVVVNLPREIDYAFVAPNTDAKLSQVKFTEETPKKLLHLVLTIPEKLSRELVDRTLKFYAFVTEASELAAIHALWQQYEDQSIPLDDVEKIKGNKVTLELIPRGVGELELIISNRYQEIKMGQDVTIRVDIHNKGTMIVQNVKAVVDPPYEWRAEVTPILIKEVAPGEKSPVIIKMTSPQELSMGEYDVQVEAQGEVGNEKVESVEKSITVRVGTSTNMLGNVALIGGLIVLVLGIALASIKISRR